MDNNYESTPAETPSPTEAPVKKPVSPHTTFWLGLSSLIISIVPCLGAIPGFILAIITKRKVEQYLEEHDGEKRPLISRADNFSYIAFVITALELIILVLLLLFFIGSSIFFLIIQFFS